MKIIIPIIKFGKAGGQRVLSNLANEWAREVKVEFLSFANSNQPYYPTKGKIKNLPLEIGNNFFKRLYCFIKCFNHNTDKTILLANYNTTVWPVLFSKNKNKFYYIQAYEPEFYDEYKGNKIKKIILKILAWLTYFMPLKRIVNSDLYLNYKNIKAEYVIPPGLDLEIYYPKKLEKENKKTLIVGCIGRVEEWKGAQDVGRAVEILHKKGLDIKLKVAFNPVEYSNHELVKPDGDKNLADYYRSLDVLVAPGHIQLGAIHYPVIEAMACNVPVITTGYYPANDENSFIVPIKSPEKIAETIEKIYFNYEEAYKKSQKAQEKIGEFAWEVVAKNFLDIIKKEMEK